MLVKLVDEVADWIKASCDFVSTIRSKDRATNFKGTFLDLMQININANNHGCPFQSCKKKGCDYVSLAY